MAAAKTQTEYTSIPYPGRDMVEYKTIPYVNQVKRHIITIYKETPSAYDLNDVKKLYKLFSLLIQTRRFSGTASGSFGVLSKFYMNIVERLKGCEKTRQQMISQGVQQKWVRAQEISDLKDTYIIIANKILEMSKKYGYEKINTSYEFDMAKNEDGWDWFVKKDGTIAYVRLY